MPKSLPLKMKWPFPADVHLFSCDIPCWCYTKLFVRDSAHRARVAVQGVVAVRPSQGLPAVLARASRHLFLRPRFRRLIVCHTNYSVLDVFSDDQVSAIMSLLTLPLNGTLPSTFTCIVHVYGYDKIYVMPIIESCLLFVESLKAESHKNIDFF